MTPEAEFEWRLGLVKAAIKMLTQPVEGPTVKDLAELSAR